ncbi:hypothetical protein [Lysobacter brunescens]|uniref:hypothetical protein n=1 Tax=Lysobacter brunescens TaxID=262323 RepID=UPI0036D8F30F
MSRRILPKPDDRASPAWRRLIGACLLLGILLSIVPSARARTATATIQRIGTGLATLERVQVRLAWPKDAASGRLQLRVGHLVAPSLGYDFRDVDWSCPLTRTGDGAWRCEGDLRAGRGPALRFGIDLGVAHTDAWLVRGESRIDVRRQAAVPDDTRIDLTRVPLAWTQALLAQAWSDARLTRGQGDARLVVSAPADGPVRVAGPLSLRGVGLETADASIAADNLGGRFALEMRFADTTTRIDLDGALQGGELLAAGAYVALPSTPVGLRVSAVGDGAGWRLPTLRWDDGSSLRVEGSAGVAPDGLLRALDLALDSADLSPVAERYLSAWLGSFGLGKLRLGGALQARVRLDAGALRGVDARFDDVAVVEPDGRFAFEGIEGDLRFSTDAPVEGLIGWRGGRLYGLDFGAVGLPLRSADGVIELQQAAAVPFAGGALRFERFRLQPPLGDRPTQAGFALDVEDLDLGTLAKSLGLPAFRGTLAGRIPDARYADDRLVFEGGLETDVFDGRVRVASLAMERPFGVAPTLSADLTLDDLDLLAVTEVFDFGSISGRLDGRIDGLRLVDWTATAFDAELRTQPRRGVKQRISQRAVQNISSVGDASFVTSLQGQLIGLFDDFGYRRIGIACRLRNQVCEMSGLDGSGPTTGRPAPGSSGSGTGGFTIVEGSGVPRLNVVGFNRRVDWPTLVERLQAVGSGDLKPVVE